MKTLPRLFLLAAVVTQLSHGAPNFAETIARPLHYHPKGKSFVVENGAEFFNRPLYGPNTSFRADAGDRPEFSLYLPGRGGNLRLGIATADGLKWLHDAEHITASYGAGGMSYIIRDEKLGNAVLRITALSSTQTEALLLRIELEGASPALTLIHAYGGANGERGTRNGDIGAERSPVKEFFQLRPEFCEGTTIEPGNNRFTLHGKTATIAGLFSDETKFSFGDAALWNSPATLLTNPPDPKRQVVIARSVLRTGNPHYMALQRLRDGMPVILDPASLPQLFQEAETKRREISEKIVVETPDPFINAAVPALCVAADGVWDAPQKAYMHGAVAWRVKLLGWRGAYSGDELGQHDRTRDYLLNWLPKQNTDQIPETILPDESVRLARNEPLLHTNGDLTKSHYDMNLPAIDILFRHLLWTGDLEFARQQWPVIERHLAWEQRLFRRPFGPDKLPLYEAYCCIWASDDLQYHGGGTTHSTAYNFYHNKMAALLAKKIGKDPSPYEREAGLILKAMHRELWLTDRGWFAEWKDLLGLQQVHPNAALWTFYHTLDSEVTTLQEAWQMSRFVDTQLPHIPLKGKNVPTGDWFTLPTTTWMPYVWSTNNVVMAESAHSSLAYWQAGRGDVAFSLYKGLLLDSMFMGLCPGNLGMCTPLDMARGETQRDFADGVGTTSRALIEGLFGVRPNALTGDLTIAPGFPAEWEHASIHHLDFDFSFKREKLTEKFTIHSRFATPMKLHLILPALRDRIASVTINGKAAKWSVLADSIETPRVEIQADSAPTYDVEVSWSGDKPGKGFSITAHPDTPIEAAFGSAEVVGISDPQKILTDSTIRNHSVQATITGTPGERTAFAKLKQGAMTWFAPISVNITPEIPATYPMTDWLKTPTVKGNFECIDLSPVLNDRITRIFKNEYRSPRSPYCSLAVPLQGIGSWIHWNPEKDKLATADIDDSGLRAVADKNFGRIILPQGIPFQTAGSGDAKNAAFVSQWDNHPKEIKVSLSGKSPHLYLLMAGSTNSMQSRFDNGEVIVTYTDGSSTRLALENPTTWWPIQEDYLIDDYAFRRPGPIPLRIDLKTGAVRTLDPGTFKGKGGRIDGGAATVLDFALSSDKELESLTFRALANEVVIGLMSATLVR
ncbi:MAG: DUF4450 domain-containing protein [Luteolibacter sp.]